MEEGDDYLIGELKLAIEEGKRNDELRRVAYQTRINKEIEIKTKTVWEELLLQTKQSFVTNYIKIDVHWANLTSEDLYHVNQGVVKALELINKGLVVTVTRYHRLIIDLSEFK